MCTVLIRSVKFLCLQNFCLSSQVCVLETVECSSAPCPKLPSCIGNTNIYQCKTALALLLSRLSRGIASIFGFWQLFLIRLLSIWSKTFLLQIAMFIFNKQVPCCYLAWHTLMIMKRNFIFFNFACFVSHCLIFSNTLTLLIILFMLELLECNLIWLICFKLVWNVSSVFLLLLYVCRYISSLPARDASFWLLPYYMQWRRGSVPPQIHLHPGVSTFVFSLL